MSRPRMIDLATVMMSTPSSIRRRVDIDVRHGITTSLRPSPFRVLEGPCPILLAIWNCVNHRASTLTVWTL